LNQKEPSDCSGGTTIEDREVESRMSMRDTESKDSGRGSTFGPSMTEFMQVFFEEQKRRDEIDRKRRDEEHKEQKRSYEMERLRSNEEHTRREAERKAEREQRAEELAAREEANRAMEEWLFRSLRDNRPAPMHAPNFTIDLPKMKGDEIEAFLTIFEAALRMSDVPVNAWKAKLTSHIPLKSLVKVESVIQQEDATYDGLVEALMGCTTLSFCSAAEDLCTGERGRLWEFEGRQTATKIRQLVKKVACDAESKDQMTDSITVALMRNRLVPSLKSYVDTARRFQIGDFLGTCEDWERSEPRGTSWFRKNRGGQIALGRQQGSNGPYPAKRPVTCFTCGKSGHMSRECRSRPPGEAVTAPMADEAPAASGSSRGKGEIVCFRCNQKCHKAPNCPIKPNGNRKVQLPERVSLSLQHEELFGSVGKYHYCALRVCGARTIHRGNPKG